MLVIIYTAIQNQMLVLSVVEKVWLSGGLSSSVGLHFSMISLVLPCLLCLIHSFFSMISLSSSPTSELSFSAVVGLSPCCKRRL